jgi:transcriptional regulator with XRE-family HTH domain
VPINHKNLARAREKSGNTKTFLAKKCGVTITTYSKWEDGDTVPGVDKAKILADIYETTVDVLFFSRVFRLI